MSAKDRISELVEQKKEQFISVSDKVWEYAELGMKEHKSTGVIIEYGFSRENISRSKRNSIYIPPCSLVRLKS